MKPLAALLVTAAMLTGCNNNLKEENALLNEENQGLRAQLSDQSAALAAANEELRERDIRLAELRRELAQAREARQEAQRDPFSGIEGVTGSVAAGEVRATVESDVLFDSGKASLKSPAKQALNEVASIIQSSYGGKKVRISGHTDTDPIRKSGYKSNYHLGFERAFAVREYLISRGVPAGQIYLASHGPNEPRGSKAQSRRVEIAVVLN
jgi:chemotaxis protein MotB